MQQMYDLKDNGEWITSKRWSYNFDSKTPDFELLRSYFDNVVVA